MKRLTFAALVLAGALAATHTASAQVIGTYRPSVVTYYPTSASTMPAAYQPQIAQANYYGAAPMATPIASSSYYAQPMAQSGCECTPQRSYPTNQTPTAYYSPAPVSYQQPISYAAPLSVPVQTVAYNTQPALGPNRYIGTNIFGNPKVFATRQPLRNALRWLGP